VREEAFGHEVVGLNGPVDVLAMNADSNTHEQVLWPFRNTAVNLQEVRTL
jgi:hypothetical protein